ncbi:MAG: hypothetical protein B7Z37_04800 [Verrucomicrobia bacterium 12-59-8]|nr:MAG: hypothetical protein B7Z37_04800 [Verrucomicrobia bacterium 12-59-8]
MIRGGFVTALAHSLRSSLRRGIQFTVSGRDQDVPAPNAVHLMYLNEAGSLYGAVAECGFIIPWLISMALAGRLTTVSWPLEPLSCPT